MASQGPAAATSSRSDPRPVLKLTKSYEPPPRPKPGRKAASPAQDNPDNRKASNRQSQRAFRERRNDYVQELESKVRSLQAGEGQRAVFYQSCAVKAQQEKDALLAENASLKAAMEDLQRRLATSEGEKAALSRRLSAVEKHHRTPQELLSDVAHQHIAKRPRRGSSSESQTITIVPQNLTRTPSDGSYAQQTMSELLEGQAVEQCGMCDREDCFCEDLGFKVAKVEPTSPRLASAAFDTEPVHAAVPLRSARLRKKAAGTAEARAKIWQVEAPASSPAEGDDGACCDGDPLGKAFCEALSQSVCSANPCSSCPSARAGPEELDILAGLPCCGTPDLCGSKTCKPALAAASQSQTQELVPCDEAWESLKGHPNIARANMATLVSVVSKRTRCDGPLPPIATLSYYHLSSPDGEEAGSTGAARARRLTVEKEAVRSALDYLDRAVGRG